MANLPKAGSKIHYKDHEGTIVFNKGVTTIKWKGGYVTEIVKDANTAMQGVSTDRGIVIRAPGGNAGQKNNDPNTAMDAESTTRSILISPTGLPPTDNREKARIPTPLTVGPVNVFSDAATPPNAIPTPANGGIAKLDHVVVHGGEDNRTAANGGVGTPGSILFGESIGDATTGPRGVRSNNTLPQVNLIAKGANGKPMPYAEVQIQDASGKMIATVKADQKGCASWTPTQTGSYKGTVTLVK